MTVPMIAAMNGRSEVTTILLEGKQIDLDIQEHVSVSHLCHNTVCSKLIVPYTCLQHQPINQQYLFYCLGFVNIQKGLSMSLGHHIIIIALQSPYFYVSNENHAI